MLAILAANTTAPGMLPMEQTVVRELANSLYFFPAALLICGALMLLFSWKTYKWVVVINCIALGFWVGGMLGAKAEVATVAAVVGGLLMGAMSWPLMKYAAALCGGLVGAVIGMVVWAYFMPNHVDIAWAGGMAGFILFAMLSFSLFKTSVILFTCVQGAAMAVLGTAALLIRYTPWEKDIVHNLTQKPVLMPLLVFAVALMGLVFQHQRHGLVGHEGPSKPGSGGKPAEPAKK